MMNEAAIDPDGKMGLFKSFRWIDEGECGERQGCGWIGRRR